MVSLVVKSCNVGCLFGQIFSEAEAVIEIQNMEHSRQKFSRYPVGGGGGG